MIEVKHLVLVKELAKEQNLTKTAENLFLTQSALSHQLKSLEDYLGVKLFSRKNKKMTANAYGDKLIESADYILSELQKVEEEISELKNDAKPLISLSTECYTCYSWLSAFIQKTRKKIPDIELNIVSEATRQPYRYLENNQLDFAIVTAPTNDDNLDFIKLFEDELVAIFDKGHPSFTGKSYLEAQHFQNQTFILYNVEQKYSDAFRLFFNPQNKFPQKILRIELTEAILEMIKAGVGISILSRWLIQSYLKPKNLNSLPLTASGIYRPWYMAINKKSSNYETVKTIAPILAEYLQNNYEY